MLFLTARRGRSFRGPLDEPCSMSRDLSATRSVAESGSVNSTATVQSAASAAGTAAAAAADRRQSLKRRPTSLHSGLGRRRPLLFWFPYLPHRTKQPILELPQLLLHSGLNLGDDVRVALSVRVV